MHIRFLNTYIDHCIKHNIHPTGPELRQWRAYMLCCEEHGCTPSHRGFESFKRQKALGQRAQGGWRGGVMKPGAQIADPEVA